MVTSFSYCSVIAVYFHMYFLPFLKDNFLFMLLLNIYTIAVLGFYLYWKFKIVAAPQYRVTKIYKATPALWVLEFEPVKGTVMTYTAGDYFFIRFNREAEITEKDIHSQHPVRLLDDIVIPLNL